MEKLGIIDNKIRARAEQLRFLKDKRLIQLGRLVVLTGADALDPATLAGAMLSAAATSDTNSSRETWRNIGDDLFYRVNARRGPNVDLQLKTLERKIDLVKVVLHRLKAASAAK